MQGLSHGLREARLLGGDERGACGTCERDERPLGLN